MAYKARLLATLAALFRKGRGKQMETTRERTTDEARALMLRRLDLRNLVQGSEAELENVFFKQASDELGAVLTRVRPLIEVARTVEELDALESEVRAGLKRLRIVKSAGPPALRNLGNGAPLLLPRYVPTVTADTFLSTLAAQDSKRAREVPELFRAAIAAGHRDAFTLQHVVRDLVAAKAGGPQHRPFWGFALALMNANRQALKAYCLRLLESEAADQAPGSEG